MNTANDRRNPYQQMPFRRMAGQSDTLPAPLPSKPNDKSFIFKPTRKNEQCKACKKWGHSSNNCFMVCQIFWVLEFIKLYPRFCRTIAYQYSIFHSRGQRAAQVRLLYRVHAISGDFDENDMINDLQIEDDDFHTELPEPMQPEE